MPPQQLIDCCVENTEGAGISLTPEEPRAALAEGHQAVGML